MWSLRPRARGDLSRKIESIALTALATPVSWRICAPNSAALPFIVGLLTIAVIAAASRAADNSWR